jgi:tRNA(fMet)-specific endonuclease VapC
MALFMLDTDISSYIMKRSDKALLHRLQAKPVGDVCISVIAMSELLFGVEISPRRQENQKALNAYLRNIEILDFPVEASLHYAEIRAHLRAHGTAIGPNDLFIAAHARYLGLTLVSNNVREFSRVPGLKTENWVDRIL